MDRTRILPPVLGLALAASLVGCAGDDPGAPQAPDPTASPGTASPGDPTPDERPTTPTVEPAESAPPPREEAEFLPPEQGEAVVAEDAEVSPVDLRFGVQDGYDRVVLELFGDGVPGWDAGYADAPEGPTDEGPVAGRALLEVTVTGVKYPTERGITDYVGPRRFTPQQAGAITEVVVDEVAGGRLQLFIGTTSALPYRVFRLDERLVVVDVQHP